ncbi:MAG: methyltransferase [Oceanicoccus sp.]
MDILNTAFGRLHLVRSPHKPSNVKAAANLRAWDAADELLLDYLDDNKLVKNTDRVLIINDGFGALACSLATYHPCSWNDSSVSLNAATHNYASNDLGNGQHKILEKLASTTDFEGTADLVLIKVPKTLALLEHQLLALRGHITGETTIVAACMVKYLEKSYLQLFEKIIGDTSVSLAVKKARLIFPTVDQERKPYQSPYPVKVDIDELGISTINYANVFSREKLDIGSRFFIENMKNLPATRSIIDLGCGNGVLGIVAKRLFPAAKITFVDESYMAIASAKASFEHFIGSMITPEYLCNFVVSDSLDQAGNEKVELVLCNPPFHQNNTVGDDIAWKMFTQSKHILTQGGRIWIVGNRHLNYHLKLKQLFGNCRNVASNKKFVILEAINQP